MKYKVVTVTNNLKDNPEYEEDTFLYSFLVKHVEDEVDTFVVEVDNPKKKWYPASEFFMIVDVTEFETKET